MSTIRIENEAGVESTSWHLVHTKPRQEDVAFTHLVRQGYECYLPRLRKQKASRGRAWVATEPMFPRYLFIKLDSSGKGKSWAPVRSTTGVSQLVRFGSAAAKVDDDLIALIRVQEQSTPTESMFEFGDAVTLTNGPFAGIEAIFQTTDGNLRSLILLEILCKPVSVWADTGSLCKIDRSDTAHL